MEATAACAAAHSPTTWKCGPVEWVLAPVALQRRLCNPIAEGLGVQQSGDASMMKPPWAASGSRGQVDPRIVLA